MSDFLLEKYKKVHGIKRISLINADRIVNLFEQYNWQHVYQLY